MTQEEYIARRKELQDKMSDSRAKERMEIQKIEDDKILVHRNAANRTESE